MPTRRSLRRHSKSPARSAHRDFRKLRLETLEGRDLLATFIWDGGGGADVNWTTAANWADDVAPTGTGAVVEDLVFAGTVGTTNTNNFAVANFNSLAFTGTGNFVINGHPITLDGGVDIDVAGGLQILNAQLLIGTASTANVGANAVLTVAGTASGSGTITKTGPGELIFAQAINLSDVNVAGGTLSLSDPLPVVKVGPSGPLGGAVPANLARASSGAVAFANSLLCCYAAHTIGGLNDGVYGNGNSWIGTGANALAGIDLPGSAVYSISSVVFGRDNAGAFC